MSQAALYQLSNLLGVLSVGRHPEWSEQVAAAGGAPDYDGAPDAANSGVDLQNAVQTLVLVQLRAAAHRRVARLTITTFDAGATYTAIVDGTSVASSGAYATVADVVADMIADINADATVNLLVTATAEDSDGDSVNDTVVLTGKAEADFSIDQTASGAAVMAITAEAVSATARVWAVSRGPNAPGSDLTDSGNPGVWAYVDQQTVAIDRRGLALRLDVAGLSRLYVELASVAGDGADGTATYTAHVFVGPCVQETDS